MAPAQYGYNANSPTSSNRMPTAPRYRPIICLSLVVLIHLIIFTALNVSRILTKHQQETASTLWILPQAPLPKLQAQPQKGNIKSLIRATKSTAITIMPPIAAQPQQPIAETPPPEVHLNLDALRADAVQQEIGRKRSPIELANEANLKNHSLETKVAEGADKAQRPDCRTEYSGAGLLAVFPVAVDLIRGKGCKF